MQRAVEKTTQEENLEINVLQEELRHRLASDRAL